MGSIQHILLHSKVTSFWQFYLLQSYQSQNNVLLEYTENELR